MEKEEEAWPFPTCLLSRWNAGTFAFCFPPPVSGGMMPEPFLPLPSAPALSTGLPHNRLSSQTTSPRPSLPSAAGLACTSWSLVSFLFATELQGRFVPSGRWAVRFAVTFMASSELVKLRILMFNLPPMDYFFVLYLCYVALQVGGRKG